MTNLLRSLAQICTNQITPDTLNRQDWDSLIPLAHQHGVIPMLWLIVKPVASQLPAQPINTLKRAVNNTRIEAFARKAVLKEVHEILSKHNINAIWLKGVALAYQYYPDFWLRYMRDLDVWVTKEQADDALQYLVNHGFEVVEQERPIDFDMYLTKIHHIVKRRGVEVEIHFRLTPPVEAYFLTDKQHQWFWESTKTISTDIGDITVLSSIAQILHIIHHDIAHHQWNKATEERDIRLQRKLDLHQLVQSETIDWHKLINVAQSLKLDKVLHYAIKENVDLFGLATYQDYPQNLYKNLPEKIVQNYKNEYAERFIQLLKNLSWSGRIRLITRAIVPTPSELKQLYNIHSAPIVAVYYLLHPLIRAKDLIQMIWKQSTS